MALSTIVSLNRSLSSTVVDAAVALYSRLGPSVVVSRLTCPSKNAFFLEYTSSVLIVNCTCSRSSECVVILPAKFYPYHQSPNPRVNWCPFKIKTNHSPRNNTKLTARTRGTQTTSPHRRHAQ